MRPIIAAIFVTPALLSHQAAIADTAVSVPAFSIEISSYRSFNDWLFELNPPASISLVSTSETSTVISLDSFEEVLHVANGDTDGTGAGLQWLASVQSTLNLQVAEGYQITGVSFSATTYAIYKDVPVPSEALYVDHGTHFNYAWSNAAISAPGTSTSLPELYSVNGYTAPVEVGWNLSNTAGLDNFDLALEVWGSVRTGATWYYIPGDEDLTKWYGTTELYYINPVLTVHTAALPVPEPTAFAMLFAGALVLLGARQGAARRDRSRITA